MKPIRLAAALAAVGALLGPSLAQAQHGEGGYYLADRLYDTCRAENGPDLERCVSYIVGVTDSVLYDWAGSLCIPVEVTPAELRSVFMKYYISDNGYHPAAVEIRSAFQQQWPCKPQSPAPAETPRG
jgi:hypothetical protein